MTRTLALASLVCFLVLASGPAAFASGPADARGALIHRTVDSSTGATIRLYQLSPSDLTMEVEARGVRVTKRFGGTRSDVAITKGPERIAFVVSPGLLVFTDAVSTVRLTAANAATERVRIERRLRASALYRDALALLKRVRLPQKSPLNMLLLPTRVFLEGPLGDMSARTEMRHWARSVSATPAKVVRVAYQNEPGECWTLYAQEAIEAFQEYEDCLASAPWNGWPWDINCRGIYTMRAVGAAAWWAKCVAIT